MFDVLGATTGDGANIFYWYDVWLGEHPLDRDAPNGPGPVLLSGYEEG